MQEIGRHAYKTPGQNIYMIKESVCDLETVISVGHNLIYSSLIATQTVGDIHFGFTIFIRGQFIINMIKKFVYRGDCFKTLITANSHFIRIM